MTEALSSSPPSFTVLITTYNRVELLDRALRSALDQTWPCQVVVVDDCSSDGTQAYMQQQVAMLQNQEIPNQETENQKTPNQGLYRLIYHRNAINQGHAKSVNIGVEIAQGTWIKFLDDDDYLANTCLETIVQAIVQRPQAVICSVQAAQVDLEGHEQSRTQSCGPGQAFYIPQEDIHYGMLLEQVPFGTPVQVAVKRDAFLQSGGWKSSFDTNFDDIESWLNIARFGDAIFIQQCLAYRTLWPGAYNHRFPLHKRLATHILIKTKIYELVNDRHHPKLPTLAGVSAYLKVYWGLIALQRRQLFSALPMLFPALFVPTTWRLLQQVIAFRCHPQASTQIHKIPLDVS